MLSAMLTCVAALGIVTASGQASAPESEVAQRVGVVYFGVVYGVRDRTKLAGDPNLPKNNALRPSGEGMETGRFRATAKVATACLASSGSYRRECDNALNDYV